MSLSDEALMEQAKAVRENAHAPYSLYYVGAAILDDAGDVHLGCNVENAAYPQGNCAEAAAVAAMVVAGGKRIVAIAVAGGGETLEACTPCGGCRQRIREFAVDSTRILTLNGRGDLVVHTMAELLPASSVPERFVRRSRER